MNTVQCAAHLHGDEDSVIVSDSDEDDSYISKNNITHASSWIIDDTDTESDIDKKKIKRQSIYDNPSNSETSSSKSSPKIKQFHRRYVVDSDSDSDLSRVLNKHMEKNENDDKVCNETDFKKPSNESQNMQKKEIINLINSSEKEDSEFIKKEDLHCTTDNSESSENSFVTNAKDKLEENELDEEIIMLAKKEIGVGNIDPIEAQKKEHLLISIDFTRNQLNKLNKFVESADINMLPDNGQKVYKTLRQHEEKLKVLEQKLSRLSRKTMSNTQEKIQTPKKNLELDDDKENVVFKSNVNRNSVDKQDLNNHQNFSNHFNEFDVREIPKMPYVAFDTAQLGAKALEKFNTQRFLTDQKLQQLHKSLTTRPLEDQKEIDPIGLKVSLMPHQQHALAWLKWREKQKPKGGILADDMGLGKTLTMISLILSTVNNTKESDSDESSSDDEWLSKKKFKRYYGGTLVICPASLINQWDTEIKNRCKKGLLSVLVFHGNNRTVEERKLSKFNIVITTYQTLVREADGETGMYRMEWNRVILDEAHFIRNHKSKACIAVCGLNAKYRWALTGTPIQNKEMDLYAILKFLKFFNFLNSSNDLQVWKRWVDNKSEAGKQRLITIMKTLMLRRTKQELQSKGCLDSLPDKNLEVIEIELDRDENLAYQKVLLFSQNLFAQFLAQRAEKQHMKELYGGKFDKPSYSSVGSKTNFTKAQKVLLDYHSNIQAHEILVLLLRLRQMCCHPALIHSMLDQQDAESSGIEEGDCVDADLLNKLQNMSFNEDENVEAHVANYKIDEKVAANLLTRKNPVFDDSRRSSKVRSIIQTIKEILKKGDKLVIVSQWTGFLKVVARYLDDIDNAKYAMFTGEVAVKNRQGIVNKLNDLNEDTNILLLSLTAGGTGLNLVGANHLLLIDIHWNPQLEAQAQDRIYRFGQKKSVYIYKFICKDTIEERVKNLQDKKLEIANYVLTGTRSMSSKLTIDDLKLLFS